MSSAVSRRSFLRGGKRGEAKVIRPPWALAEEAFAAACDHCGACLWVCPEGILARSPDGSPHLDFSKGACSFCGKCASSCDRGAFRAERDSPWSLVALIGAGCLSAQGVACRVCGDYCAPRAITFPPSIGGSTLPQLNASACTGCGGCVAPCPVGAIEMKG